MTDNLQKEINDILESSKDEIKKAAMAQVKEALQTNIAWCMEREIKSAVDSFFQAEIKGEINQALMNSKEEILEQLKQGIVSSCASLAKELLKMSEKNLASSWSLNNITKELFK